ncbi:MAG: hypothetical protein QME51_10350, partial [Planctomycetota bacterium]|nr:hypothetical protein [Planctomycetota bacterium]
MKLFYFISIGLLSSFIYAQPASRETSSVPTQEAKIEISEIKCSRDTLKGRKVVTSITIKGENRYKPSTIVNFALVTTVETLTENENVEVTQISSELKGKKFTEIISLNKLALPPGRYYIYAAPSPYQGEGNPMFSQEDTLRLAIYKDFVIGTFEERLEFLRYEYDNVLFYLEELARIYDEMKIIID